MQNRRSGGSNERPTTPNKCHGQVKNIVSMSLYGNGANFIAGAVENAKNIRAVYPGWVLRVYTSSGPEAAAMLRSEGAQVRCLMCGFFVLGL